MWANMGISDQILDFGIKENELKERLEFFTMFNVYPIV